MSNNGDWLLLEASVELEKTRIGRV